MILEPLIADGTRTIPAATPVAPAVVLEDRCDQAALDAVT